jgi:hypothetical protein
VLYSVGAQHIDDVREDEMATKVREIQKAVRSEKKHRGGHEGARARVAAGARRIGKPCSFRNGLNGN